MIGNSIITKNSKFKKRAADQSLHNKKESTLNVTNTPNDPR